jgi:hypothetical protein
VRPISAVILLLVNGCAPRTVWIPPPNITVEQVGMDQARCQLQAKTSTYGINSIVEKSYERNENYALCMKAAGYTTREVR